MGRVLAVAVATAVAGCAVMDPYIRHSPELQGTQLEGCTAPLTGLASGGDAALKYACEMLVRMEKARSQITRTRSALTTLLFPAAGIVAYNSARGFNAPTSTALTAGGIATYSTISTLAQEDRVRIYNSGLRSISCGLGVYGRALAAQGADSLNAAILNKKLVELQIAIEKIEQNASRDPESQSMVEAWSRILAAARQRASAVSKTAMVDAQLTSLVNATISAVNSQLTGTIPNNSEAFGVAIGTLQANKPRDVETSCRPSDGKEDLDIKLQAVCSLLDGLKEEEKEAAPATANFSECNYVPIEGIGVQATAQPLMLGANDALNNAQIELGEKDVFETRIFGGYPPYQTTVVGPQPSIIVGIGSENGATSLKVEPPSKLPTEDQEFQIVVGDSMGRDAKVLKVKVKAAAR